MSRFLLKAVIIFLIMSCQPSNTEHPPLKGTLEFSKDLWSAETKLGGEWYFWPNELLTYGVIDERIEQNRYEMMSVPKVWQKLGPITPSEELIKTGTLALKLKNFPIGNTFSVRVPNVSSSLTLLLDDNEITRVGKVSEYKERGIPSNKLSIADFTINRTSPLLIMHISNYDTPYTGTWDVITLGDKQTISESRQWSIIITALISGALIFMGIYHLALYILRSKDPTTLFFSIICLLMATRNLIMGERILLDLFPNSRLSWRVAFNIEHLSAHMTLPLFYYYFSRLFKGYVTKISTQIVSGVALLWMLLQLFTPVIVHQRFLSWYEYFLVIAALYLMFVIIKASKDKQQGAYITLTGILFLILTSVNDVLLSNGIIESFYMASIGVFIYTFSQSFILSQRFSTLFTQVENYSKELQTLNHSLQRFIPQEMLEYLDKDSIVDVELGDFSKEEMTVLFLDIRDFTTFSETMSPSDNFRFINSFLKQFGPIIRQHKGFVDKYMGDGIMALFPQDADHALNAALEVRKRLKILNEERAGYNLMPIKVGIGINTGNVMLGTIGENRRMDSTVISDTVNTASRLEDLTKKYGVDTLLSGNTINNLKNPSDYEVKHISNAEVKGKHEMVQVYTLL